MSALRLINETTASSVEQIDITNVFSADFDIYHIEIADIDYTSASSEGWTQLRYINSAGSVISSGSLYEQAQNNSYSYTSGTQYRTTGADTLYEMYGSWNNTATLGGFSMWIFNPFSSSSYTFSIGQFVGQRASGMQSPKDISVLTSTASITGFRIFGGAGHTINNAKIKTYGLRVDS
mgnify:CR=1 FL=1